MEKFIVLDEELKPRKLQPNKLPVWELGKKPQSDLMEQWVEEKKSRDKESAEDRNRWNRSRQDESPRKEEEPIKKTFALGSKEEVNFGRDLGFFATLLASYNNHWVLKTCPEDWWIAIIQKISVTVDMNANVPDVRQFFVSHEGKKTLEVTVAQSIYDVDYELFFKQMRSQISQNINNPEYTALTECNFSQTTSVQRMVSDIMLMYGFKEYFDYRMVCGCGIPGVTMVGTEEDWKALIEKHTELEKFLQPIEEVLKLSAWFKSSKSVLEKLLQTYQGNPDRDWWSKLIGKIPGASGIGLKPGGGWFIRDFLGLGEYASLSQVPTGINVVPLTIARPRITEEADLVGGVTGYKVEEDAVIMNTTKFKFKTKTKFPMVQTVHGWGLFLKPDSVFR